MKSTRWRTPEFFGAAESSRAVRAERVRLVDHQQCADRLADLSDSVERCDVPADRIQALDDDEASAWIGLASQLAAKVVGRVVAERKDARPAQPRAVVDAGVALDVEQHDVTRRRTSLR